MTYPKYLETSCGQLAVFSTTEHHIDISRRCPSPIVSAGMVSAARHPRGKFFGESTTLHLRANATLDWSKHAWFEGILGKAPAFATSSALLESIGATGIRPASLREFEGIHFPSSGRHPDAVLLDFFLP